MLVLWGILQNVVNAAVAFVYAAESLLCFGSVQPKIVGWNQILRNRENSLKQFALIIGEVLWFISIRKQEKMLSYPSSGSPPYRHDFATLVDSVSCDIGVENAHIRLSYIGF